MRTFVFSILIIPLGFISCSQESQPIDYGKDNCHWCQMRIMDPKFGSEAITDKGRVYKFDSGECLLHYLNESDAAHSLLEVTDFESPESLVAADTAWFLVSEKMPSPMGGFLNAFHSKDRALAYQAKFGGEIFNWNQVKNEFGK